MNILVTGANGQLGTEIRKIVDKMGNGHPDHNSGEPNYYIFTARNPMSPKLQTLDITDREAVLRFVSEHKINVVINCAAYTNSEKAEEEPDKAFEINVKGSENLAEACKGVGAVLIHISTDYVFNGDKNGYYEETDETSPLCVYGMTKRMGEVKIIDSGCYHMIFRTSWLYGGDKKNFAKTMFNLMTQADGPIKVVNDQWGTPTYVVDLAEFLVHIIEHHNADNQYLNHSGIYHFANEGEATWFMLAREIRTLIMTYSDTNATVIACKTGEFPTKVVRPKNSRLSTKKLSKDFNYTPRMWDEALIDCIKKYLKENE